MSNNVQPEQLTFEIIGDAYQFNKERISHLGRGEGTFMENRISSDLTNKNEFNIPEKTASEKYKTDKYGIERIYLTSQIGQKWNML